MRKRLWKALGIAVIVLGGLQPALAAGRAAAPPVAPVAAVATPAANTNFGTNVPGNQPSARFAGHEPARVRKADPLPTWLGSAPVKLGVVLKPNKKVKWMSRATYNPAAIVRKGKVHLLVRVQDEEGAGKWYGTSRIGLATSSDGVNFDMQKTPVLEPTEWYEAEGGTEDPRVTKIGNKYVMTYTAYRFADKTARLAMATSTDLKTWTKTGLVFPDGTLPKVKGRNPNWSKAGALVPRKVNGEYIMYFGDEDIYIARSKDLKTWKADPKPVMKPRKGFFDGIMIEPGPAPEIDHDGNIRLLYNGDAAPDGYAAGEVVFSGADPTKIISRSKTPLLKVTEPFERAGQVGNVIFLAGTAEFKGKRFFYYGAADDKVAVAVADKGKRPGPPVAGKALGRPLGTP